MARQKSASVKPLSFGRAGHAAMCLEQIIEARDLSNAYFFNLLDTLSPQRGLFALTRIKAMYEGLGKSPRDNAAHRLHAAANTLLQHPDERVVVPYDETQVSESRLKHFSTADVAKPSLFRRLTEGLCVLITENPELDDELRNNWTGAKAARVHAASCKSRALTF